MARYTGPVCKRCRREGMKLFLKGTRCSMAKCAIEREKPAPGVHGQRRARKSSEYAVQLREKQRLKRQYGMQEAQFRLVFKRALGRRGVTGEQLLQSLESRLDNVVYRMGFAPSRQAARQMVLHNHVTVNARRAQSASIELKPGSVIQVKDRPGVREGVKRCLDALGNAPVPAWMTRDDAAFNGQYVRVPTREEIAPIVNEQLVVELYSK